MVVFGQNGFYSDKVIVFVQTFVVFGQSGRIRARWLYSGKVVVFGQKWLYSGKVVVFRQKWLNSDKVVEFEQKCFYSGKVFVFGQKRL